MRIVWEYVCYVSDNALARLEARDAAQWAARPATVDLAPVRFLQHAPGYHRQLITLIAVCAPVVLGFALRVVLR